MKDISFEVNASLDAWCFGNRRLLLTDPEAFLRALKAFCAGLAARYGFDAFAAASPHFAASFSTARGAAR